jgi:uncharacterized protein (DUF305 family)
MPTVQTVIAALSVIGVLAPVALAQADPHMHHMHHPMVSPAPATNTPIIQLQLDHSGHSHDLGDAGSTYDLRWLDAMAQHHKGALLMSEFVFNIGSPGVGALANSIWREQAREIKAMRQWRKSWYPEAPIYPVALKSGGDPNSIAGLERMSPAQIEAMQMMGSTPNRENRVTWFLEGMLHHHGGALQMAHDALKKSTNTTLRRLAQQIIVAQRAEIIELRGMLLSQGLSKPEYHKYDEF